MLKFFLLFVDQWYNLTDEKIFVIYHGHGNFGDTVINTRLLEYDLSTPYSLSTMSLVTDAGIELEDECANPMGIRFSNDGKKLFVLQTYGGINNSGIYEYTLSTPFDLTTVSYKA